MSNQQNKKVFIADDDALLREMLKQYLTTRLACDVSIFATGEECLSHLSENPDVVILDYFLDSVQKDAANGMDVLRTIRKQNPNTQVIMLSAQEQYGVALQTLQKGAVQYVIKDADAYKKIAEIMEAL